jgi:hypothetical protein
MLDLRMLGLLFMKGIGRENSQARVIVHRWNFGIAPLEAGINPGPCFTKVRSQ